MNIFDLLTELNQEKERIKSEMCVWEFEIIEGIKFVESILYEYSIDRKIDQELKEEIKDRITNYQKNKMSQMINISSDFENGIYRCFRIIDSMIRLDNLEHKIRVRER